LRIFSKQYIFASHTFVTKCIYSFIFRPSSI